MWGGSLRFAESDSSELQQKHWAESFSSGTSLLSRLVM
jgi:hypothetical protein